jgi:hypothetical protein
MRVTPGPNKFGGTMRFFFGLNSRWYMFITNGYPCCERLYGWAWRTGKGAYGSPTGALDWTEYSLQEIGGTNISFGGTRVHTYLTTGGGTPNNPGAYIERYQAYFQTKAPWSTGMASVFVSGGAYITSVAATGYDNRTENRELGTMSLVSPFMTHEYVTSFNPSDPVEAVAGWGRIYTMKVMFLPEPVGILMLGAGIIGLVGAYRLRRR